MELKDLVGKHELSGLDTTTEKVKRYGEHYDDCNVIRFILDGKTYKAIEDPEDGYRSYLNDLLITDEKITNTFPPQKVIGKMKDDSKWETNNTIQFIDEITGKIVLEVGTDNTDDYYPYCVLNWYPQNLAINIGK